MTGRDLGICDWPQSPFSQAEHANAGRLTSRGKSEQSLKVASHVGRADLGGHAIDANRAHGQAHDMFDAGKKMVNQRTNSGLAFIGRLCL